jgi:pyruvate/2-oxoglutarate dehydrogenase complex dihydrolipoamide acyltransferase (E2) component
MKTSRLVSALLLLFSAALLPAEEVTLRQSAVLKAERTVVSLKAGTVVELVTREGDTLTVKYKDLTGKIPASKLDEPKAAAAKPKEDSAPAQPPQTGYGKAVQKAKDNAKAHDKNVVKPTDEIMP